MKYNAAIFDMDGLLLDTERLCMKIFKQTCLEFNLPFKYELYLSVIGRNAAGVEPIIKQGYGDSIDYPVFYNVWKQHYSAIVEHEAIPIKDGVLVLLNWLQNQKIPMAVATSTHNDLAHTKLRLAGLDKYFTHITCGDEVANGKPDPEIYQLAAQRLNISPQHCLAFEDSNNGVKAAVSAQMNTLQIIDLVEPDQETIALGHSIFSSMHDALAFLQNNR